MELTPRLRAVAEQAPRGASFADIGTDHGYLPVWLLLHGVIASAIAADLREGPLERAKRTAAQHGVSEKISFRLCNGLSGIAPAEADTVAIAGMGGDTIAAILDAAPWTKEPGKLLLLQPMTAQPELRKWLGAHGYTILAERVAREGGRFYSILTAAGGPMPPLTPGELWAGRHSGDPLRGDYLDHIAGKARRMLAGRAMAARPDRAAIGELEAVLAGLLELKEEWERGNIAGG